MSRWQIKAPAKLTWSLEVTGVRPDGFHELRSEMVTLDLADELVIDDHEEGLEIVDTRPSRDGHLSTGPANLVSQALTLAGRRAQVRLTKVIPVGGGLGGGSADAGAILRWAGFDDLLKASQLGGDVPFCRRGGDATRPRRSHRGAAPATFWRRDGSVLSSLRSIDRRWASSGRAEPPAPSCVRSRAEAERMEKAPRCRHWRRGGAGGKWLDALRGRVVGHPRPDRDSSA